MNRCTTPTHSRRSAVVWSALALCAVVLLGSVAQAQTLTRNFPRDAKRGVMVVTVPPEVRLDGKTDRLSPGTRIRQPNNLIVMSGTLIGQELTVNYTRDASGLLRDVWILSEEEARQRPASKP